MNISEYFRHLVKTTPEMSDMKMLISAAKYFSWSEDEMIKRATYPKYYRNETKRAEATREKLRAELHAEMAKE